VDFKAAVEKHPLWFAIGLVVGGFGAGVGAYAGILRIAEIETISSRQLTDLRKAGELQRPSVKGTWRRRGDGATVNIDQNGDSITFSSEGPELTHIMNGLFEPGVFRTTTIRRNLHNACEARLYGFLKQVDSTHLQLVTESSDGHCGVPIDMKEDHVWTRQ
jgi:hypothetical protein